MIGHILQEPLWLQAWVLWMGLVNAAGVLFWRHREGRVVIGVFLGNLVFMQLLYTANGYNRLLGLSHVVWWTPLLVYLWRRGVPLRRESVADRWLAALFATNALSLVIDYVDVARYLVGDRS